MNTICLIGRPTTAIEQKMTTSGKAVVNFTLAVPKNFKKNEANFIPVVAFEKTAELLSLHVGKGQLVGIQGELTSRKFEDSQGNKRVAYEVVATNFDFCGSKAENTEGGGITMGAIANAAQNANIVSQANLEELSSDDDLPF